MTDLSLDHSDLVAELLKELSNHNERVEERKIALYELMKLTQEESFSVWDEHFKTILLLLSASRKRVQKMLRSQTKNNEVLKLVINCKSFIRESLYLSKQGRHMI